MTVKELVEYLNNYPENSRVSMTQCNCDNPMDDDNEISDVLFIESLGGERKLVLIPY